MEYELTIEKGKAKPVIAFLKQLDFVKVTPLKKKSAGKTKMPASKKKSIPYFNAVSGWNIDAAVLRKQSAGKNAKW